MRGRRAVLSVVVLASLSLCFSDRGNASYCDSARFAYYFYAGDQKWYAHGIAGGLNDALVCTTPLKQQREWTTSPLIFERHSTLLGGLPA